MRQTLSLEEFGKHNKKFFKDMLSKFPEYAVDMAEILADEIVDRAKDNIRDGRGMVPLYNKGPEVGENTPKFTSENATYVRREENRDSFDPLIDTGELLDSIEVKDISGSRMSVLITVGTDRPGAAVQEFGDENPWDLRDIPGRPYLGPAFDWAKHDTGFKRKFNKQINTLITSLIFDSLGY